jgi:hypothetical protein
MSRTRALYDRYGYLSTRLRRPKNLLHPAPQKFNTFNTFNTFELFEPSALFAPFVASQGTSFSTTLFLAVLPSCRLAVLPSRLLTSAANGRTLQVRRSLAPNLSSGAHAAVPEGQRGFASGSGPGPTFGRSSPGLAAPGA